MIEDPPDKGVLQSPPPFKFKRWRPRICRPGGEGLFSGQRVPGDDDHEKSGGIGFDTSLSLCLARNRAS